MCTISKLFLLWLSNFTSQRNFNMFFIWLFNFNSTETQNQIWNMKVQQLPSQEKKIWDAKSKKLTSWNPWNAFLHIYDRLKKANVCILKDFRCTHVLCVGIHNHNMKSAINQVVFIFKIAQFSSCLQLGKANNFPEERNGSHLKVHIAPMM